MTHSKLISYTMALVCEHWDLNLGKMGRTINSFLFSLVFEIFIFYCFFIVLLLIHCVRNECLNKCT